MVEGIVPKGPVHCGTVFIVVMLKKSLVFFARDSVFNAGREC